MKKPILLLLSLFLVTPVIAAQNGATSGQGVSGSSQGMSATVKPISTIGVVPSVKNAVQNEVQTKNQGEESQIQVNTEEKLDSSEGKNTDGKSEQALQNMSDVAKQVQSMLEIKTTGGIGDQVRVVAKEQTQAQTKIQEHVMKMEIGVL